MKRELEEFISLIFAKKDKDALFEGRYSADDNGRSNNIKRMIYNYLVVMVYIGAGFLTANISKEGQSSVVIILWFVLFVAHVVSDIFAYQFYRLWIGALEVITEILFLYVFTIFLNGIWEMCFGKQAIEISFATNIMKESLGEAFFIIGAGTVALVLVFLLRKLLYDSFCEKFCFQYKDDIGQRRLEQKNIQTNEQQRGDSDV